MRAIHSTLKTSLFLLCTAFLVLMAQPASAADDTPATPTDEQRSFNERLRGLWGDAKSAGSELGSQAGEMWDSARESSSELWDEARDKGNSWAEEARRRWRENSN